MNNSFIGGPGNKNTKTPDQLREDAEQLRHQRIEVLTAQIRGILGTRFDRQLDPMALDSGHKLEGLKPEDLTVELVVAIAQLMSELTYGGIDRDPSLVVAQWNKGRWPNLRVRDGMILTTPDEGLDLAPNTHMGLQGPQWDYSHFIDGQLYAWVMETNIPREQATVKNPHPGKVDIATPLAKAGIPLGETLIQALHRAAI